MEIPTTKRLDAIKSDLDTALDIITDLWTNKELGLFSMETPLNEIQLKLRESIVSSRIAVLNARYELEMAILILDRED